MLAVLERADAGVITPSISLPTMAKLDAAMNRTTF